MSCSRSSKLSLKKGCKKWFEVLGQPEKTHAPLPPCMEEEQDTSTNTALAYVWNQYYSTRNSKRKKGEERKKKKKKHGTTSVTYRKEVSTRLSERSIQQNGNKGEGEATRKPEERRFGCKSNRR